MGTQWSVVELQARRHGQGARPDAEGVEAGEGEDAGGPCQEAAAVQPPLCERRRRPWQEEGPEHAAAWQGRLNAPAPSPKPPRCVLDKLTRTPRSRAAEKPESRHLLRRRRWGAGGVLLFSVLTLVSLRYSHL